MNLETFLDLEPEELERVRGIAKLAILMKMSFKDTEMLIDKMKKQLVKPDEIQEEYEAALDAELNI